MSWPLYVVCCCALASVHITNAEFFSALVDMESLIETEAVLIKTLNTYIQEQEEKLSILKRKLAFHTQQHNKVPADGKEYLTNPVNAYLIVKRLTEDWNSIESTIKEEVKTSTVLANITEAYKFPTDEDLNGAAVALIRLQITYKLNTSSIASGELNGVQYGSKMSAGDCFEVGRQLYFNEDYFHTVLWMKEALERLEKEEFKTACKVLTLDYLQFSTFKEGEIRIALKLAKELLELDPGHERVQANVGFYENLLETQDRIKKYLGLPPDDTEDYIVKKKETSTSDNLDDMSEIEVYEMLCRGALTISEAEAAELRCRYTTRNNPYFILSPVKEEEALLHPRILMFHDVISDNEINIITKHAQPMLERAGVHNEKKVGYRISKVAWLTEEDHPFLKTIDRRVEALTGLTMDTAERLQVNNYGIGGHYNPHYDFARKEELDLLSGSEVGNRIATFMFYMSDVAQGGATVFPSLKVALSPVKGSAAFWYNLQPSGEPDYMTRHAACPVLVGTKWVSNKWIHEVGQQFRRPCGTTYDYRE